jgi:hypothetical protein
MKRYERESQQMAIKKITEIQNKKLVVSKFQSTISYINLELNTPILCPKLH